MVLFFFNSFAKLSAPKGPKLQVIKNKSFMDLWLVRASDKYLIPSSSRLKELRLISYNGSIF
jgi:hypothetical protein